MASEISRQVTICDAPAASAVAITEVALSTSITTATSVCSVTRVTHGSSEVENRNEYLFQGAYWCCGE
jgi:hypothetical protein